MSSRHVSRQDKRHGHSRRRDSSPPEPSKRHRSSHRERTPPRRRSPTPTSASDSGSSSRSRSRSSSSSSSGSGSESSGRRLSEPPAKKARRTAEAPREPKPAAVLVKKVASLAQAAAGSRARGRSAPNPSSVLGGLPPSAVRAPGFAAFRPEELTLLRAVWALVRAKIQRGGDGDPGLSLVSAALPRNLMPFIIVSLLSRSPKHAAIADVMREEFEEALATVTDFLSGTAAAVRAAIPLLSGSAVDDIITDASSVGFDFDDPAAANPPAVCALSGMQIEAGTGRLMVKGQPVAHSLLGFLLLRLYETPMATGSLIMKNQPSMRDLVDACETGATSAAAELFIRPECFANATGFFGKLFRRVATTVSTLNELAANRS